MNFQFTYNLHRYIVIQIIISDPFETVSFWIGAKSKVNANETITWITNGNKINLEMSQTYSL